MSTQARPLVRSAALRWAIPIFALSALAFFPAAGSAQAPTGSLFVVTGQSGELTRVEGQPGRYDLLLRDIGQVTSFTDRPARRADALSPRQLVRRWRAFGFVEDPPNAALVLAGAPRGRDVVILELSRPRVVRGGHGIAVRARPVPRRRPAGLRRFVRRADRRVAARFGAASLFIDPSGQQSVTLALTVTGLTNAIVSFNLFSPWTVSQLEADLAEAPLGQLITGARGFVLTGGQVPAPQLGFTLVANGTGNVIKGSAQVPPGTTVQLLAPTPQTITNGPFEIQIP